MKFIKTLLCLVAFDFLFITAFIYGVDKEIERQEDEAAYHIQRCESDSNYYPDFCNHLLGR